MRRLLKDQESVYSGKVSEVTTGRMKYYVGRRGIGLRVGGNWTRSTKR